MTPVSRLVYDDAPWLSTSVQVRLRLRRVFSGFREGFGRGLPCLASVGALAAKAVLLRPAGLLRCPEVQYQSKRLCKARWAPVGGFPGLR
jgi:hypothetical protein